MTRTQLTVADVRIELDAPDEVTARFHDAVAGPAVRPGPEPAELRYAITAEDAGAYGLERDGGGLCRSTGLEAVSERLVEDLVQTATRRRPGRVVVDGGVVVVEGRGVLLLGSGRGTSTLLAAMVGAGAACWSDGLAVLDDQARAHPVVLGREDGAVPTAELRPVPVVLIVAAEHRPDAVWAPAEVTGTRAALGALGHVLAPGGTSPAARSLARRLAEQAVELRGPRPEAEAVADDLLERARRIERPEPVDAGEGADPAPIGVVVSPPFVRFEDFLAPDEHERLLEFARSRAGDFESSGVHAADPAGGDQHPEIRRSRSLYDLEPVWDLFESRIVEALPHVRRELGVAWFPLGAIEGHLTVHGDGDHFTLHVDDATEDTSLREVSAVYYFNREPRHFTGGALRLFDTVDRGGAVEPVGTHTDIEPTDNSLVFFRSDTFHEVLPVHVDSDDFADQRFTLVFWARRVPPVQAVFRGDPETVTARQHQLLPSLTPDGFRIVATPRDVQDRLVRRFEEGRPDAVAEATDATYLPTGEPSVIPLGEEGPRLLADLQAVHETWCGRSLVPSAAYGIRVYGEGQTLRPHCDRVETHVISSIVHVAADVDEPWALTIQDAAGKVHDVHLQPGEMLLYESAKLPHGRPEPLRGRQYASVFLHYRPVDWATTLADVCRTAADLGLVV